MTEVGGSRAGAGAGACGRGGGHVTYIRSLLAVFFANFVVSLSCSTHVRCIRQKPQ